ncbi:MAG: proton-conducting transporter membrane subunit, partial [Methanobacteriota archaeon]
KNIDELGGLLVRMPWTGGLFFIGMLSISAIPPFNGFVGELLIYQALILGLAQSDPVMQVILIIALSLLGLCGALTAVCFVKAFGLTFLALPRTSGAVKAREVSGPMKAGPAILAVSCLLTGVFSAQILTLLGYPGYLPDMLLLSILLLGTGGIIYTAVYAFASRETRVAITWGCGMNAPTNRMEYTGSGFTEPVVRIFAPVYRTRFSVSRRYFDEDHCFLRDGAAKISLMKFFEEYLYLPIARIIDAYAAGVAKLQNGRVDSYVLYVFIAVVLLIVIIGWIA